MKPKPFYTPSELQEVLPLGRSQIYALLKDGTLPSIRLGKKYITPVAALENWLATCGASTHKTTAEFFNLGRRD